MSSSLVVSIAQYAPAETTAANLEAMAPLVATAADAGARVIVFPEYSQAFTHGLGEDWASRHESLDGPFVVGLGQMSARNDGMIIIAGMLASGLAGEKPTNTIVAVDHSGVVSRAEKIHPYDAFGASESRFISPAKVSEPSLVSAGEQRLGLMACYDLRFPEVTRRLVDAGATALVVPAQWVPGPHKNLHWQTLLSARAIEAQAYVIASGHPQPEGVGHSQVIDPWGEIVCSCDGPELGTKLATLEMSLVQEVRQANPLSAARRFDVNWRI